MSFPYKFKGFCDNCGKELYDYHTIYSVKILNTELMLCDRCCSKVNPPPVPREVFKHECQGDTVYCNGDCDNCERN